MIKLSQRDITSEVTEFVDRNREFITSDVKRLLFTAKNIKLAAKKVVVNYLCKEIFGQSAEEIERNLANDSVGLDQFHSRVKKLEEVYGGYIERVIEQHVTSKYIEEFKSNVEINQDAIAIIKSRIDEM
jgi:hypothetical protein